MFKNPFSFNGRIRRLEYGLSYLIYMAVIIAVSFLTESLILMETTILYIILAVVYIPLVWFLIAQGAKRCHDRDNSGWFQLIPFYQLWMFFAPGDIGPNRFGPDPKDPTLESSTEVIDDEILRYDD